MKNKKEIKNSYKEKKFKAGVFQIRNLSNHKVFVDSSSDLDAIWNRHKFTLNFGNHPNAELQKDWKESGEANFVYEILSEIKQDPAETRDYRKEAKQLEAMFLDEIQPFGDKGYNAIALG